MGVGLCMSQGQAVEAAGLTLLHVPAQFPRERRPPGAGNAAEWARRERCGAAAVGAVADALPGTASRRAGEPLRLRQPAPLDRPHLRVSIVHL